jgi:hypothetical protein
MDRFISFSSRELVLEYESCGKPPREESGRGFLMIPQG